MGTRNELGQFVKTWINQQLAQALAKRVDSSTITNHL